MSDRRRRVSVLAVGKKDRDRVTIGSEQRAMRLVPSMSPRFRAILERPRGELKAGRVVPSAELRRIFGLKRQAG